MKTLTLLLGLVLLPIIAARAEESKYYFKAEAGPAFMEDIHVIQVQQGFNLKTRTGFRLDFIGGYNLNRCLSLELNTGMLRTKLEDNGRTAYYQVPLMANVVARHPVGNLEPYIGLGIGGVGIFTDTPDGAAATFGAQALAGLQYRIGNNCGIGIGYKFLYATEARPLSFLEFGPSLTHSVSAAFTFQF